MDPVRVAARNGMKVSRAAPVTKVAGTLPPQIFGSNEHNSCSAVSLPHPAAPSSLRVLSNDRTRAIFEVAGFPRNVTSSPARRSVIRSRHVRARDRAMFVSVRTEATGFAIRGKLYWPDRQRFNQCIDKRIAPVARFFRLIPARPDPAPGGMTGKCVQRGSPT